MQELALVIVWIRNGRLQIDALPSDGEQGTGASIKPA